MVMEWNGVSVIWIGVLIGFGVCLFICLFVSGSL